ncbi:hypothetical protein BH10CYA1_BH10CYA1_08890 [soil metagenome]
MNQARQGDVFLLRVNSVPLGASAHVTTDQNIILAHGEVTGHAHRVNAAQAQIYTLLGQRFLKVSETTKLFHEEHGAIELTPGCYKVVIQREYAPNAFQQVVD